MNKSRGSKVNGGPDQPLCSAHCGDEIYGSGLPKPRTPHVDWLSAMKRCDKGRRQTALWDKRLQERGDSGGQCWSSTREKPVLGARWQGGRRMLKSTWNTAFQLPGSAKALTRGVPRCLLSRFWERLLAHLGCWSLIGSVGKRCTGSTVYLWCVMKCLRSSKSSFWFLIWLFKICSIGCICPVMLLTHLACSKVELHKLCHAVKK